MPYIVIALVVFLVVPAWVPHAIRYWVMYATGNYPNVTGHGLWATDHRPWV